MKAFLAAVVVGAVLSIGAWQLLGDMGFSSAERNSLESVRLAE